MTIMPPSLIKILARRPEIVKEVFILDGEPLTKAGQIVATWKTNLRVMGMQKMIDLMSGRTDIYANEVARVAHVPAVQMAVLRELAGAKPTNSKEFTILMLEHKRIREMNK